MNPAGAGQAKGSDWLACSLTLVPLVLLFVIHPRWPNYEKARLALFAIQAPILAFLLFRECRRTRPGLPHRGLVGLILWTGAIILSFTAAEDLRLWLLATGFFAGFFGLFLSAAALPAQVSLRRILEPWAWGGIGLAGLGILQALNLDPLGVTVPHEAGSFLGNRNAAAEVCLVLAPILAGLGLDREANLRQKITFGLATTLVVFYAGITRSTAGLLALLTVLFLAFLAPHGVPRLLGKKTTKKISGERMFFLALAPLLTLVVFQTGMALSPRPPIEPTSSPATAEAPNKGPLEALPTTWQVRAYLWQASLRLYLDHPLRGCGNGCYEREIPPYRNPKEIAISSHQHSFETRVTRAHSDPLHLLAEIGPLGLAGYLCLLFSLIMGGLRARTRSLTTAGFTGAALAFLVHGLFRAPLLNAPAAAFAAVALGLLARPTPGEEPKRRWRWSIPLLLAALFCLPAWYGLRSFVAQSLAAMSLGEGGQPDRLDAALDTDPNDPDLLLLRTRRNFRDPKLANIARADLKRVLDLRPRDPVVLRTGAELVYLAAKGKKETLAKAATLAELARKSDPKNPATLALLARIRGELGDHDGAISALKEMSGKWEDALKQRAAALAKEGKEETACRYLMAWLENKPNRPHQWRGLALRWRKLGRHTWHKLCMGYAHRGFALSALAENDLKTAALQARLYNRKAEVGDHCPRLLSAIIACRQGNPEKAKEIANQLLQAKQRPTAEDCKLLSPWLAELGKIKIWQELLTP